LGTGLRRGDAVHIEVFSGAIQSSDCGGTLGWFVESARLMRHDLVWVGCWRIRVSKDCRKAKPGKRRTIQRTEWWFAFRTSSNPLNSSPESPTIRIKPCGRAQSQQCCCTSFCPISPFGFRSGFKCRRTLKLPNGRQAPSCQVGVYCRMSPSFRQLHRSRPGAILERQVHGVPRSGTKLGRLTRTQTDELHPLNKPTSSGSGVNRVSGQELPAG
jgi:hypothetical protein